MKITLCGSMAFAGKIKDVAGELKELGHEVEFPQPLDEEDVQTLSGLIEERGGIGNISINDEIWQAKAAAIQDHFVKISWAEVVLILNFDKKGIAGYIGGNTLMEIAVASFLGKRIFLWQDISNKLNYKEEILGCLPSIIYKDLGKINA